MEKKRMKGPSYLGLGHAGSSGGLVTKVCFCFPGRGLEGRHSPQREVQVQHSILLNTALQRDSRATERGAQVPRWMGLTPRVQAQQGLQVLWRVWESSHISGLSALTGQLNSGFCLKIVSLQSTRPLFIFSHFPTPPLKKRGGASKRRRKVAYPVLYGPLVTSASWSTWPG